MAVPAPMSTGLAPPETGPPDATGRVVVVPAAMDGLAVEDDVERGAVVGIVVAGAFIVVVSAGAVDDVLGRVAALDGVVVGGWVLVA